MPTTGRNSYTTDSRGDEVTAYYVLYGQFDPDEITELVTVQATRTLRVGEVAGRSGRRSEFARWELCPNLPSPAELEDHVGAVLAALEPAFEQFCELGERYEALIQCVVYAYGAEAGQHFEQDHVRCAGLLHAAIDLDLYALGDSGESDEP